MSIYRDRSASQSDKPRLIHNPPGNQKLHDLLTVVLVTTLTLARQWLLSWSTNHLVSFFPFLIFQACILIHKWNYQFAGGPKLYSDFFLRRAGTTKCGIPLIKTVLWGLYFAYRSSQRQKTPKVKIKLDPKLRFLPINPKLKLRLVYFWEITYKIILTSFQIQSLHLFWPLRIRFVKEFFHDFVSKRTYWYIGAKGTGSDL